MQKIGVFIPVAIAFIAAGVFVFARQNNNDSAFVTYVFNPKTQPVKMYWKEGGGQPFKSIGTLRTWLKNNDEELVFAMNGGMYKPDGSPQGLFIEDGKTVTPLDTAAGTGNFYLKPNGVFYINRNGQAAIKNTTEFINDGSIRYATQSGPMLVNDGRIHAAFTKGSTNVTIRNGVGILPDGRILFVMSKEEINFYDFAAYFKNKGCKNALYLDGLVSRTYFPEKGWMQTDGDFGVMIGVAVEER